MVPAFAGTSIVNVGTSGTGSRELPGSAPTTAPPPKRRRERGCSYSTLCPLALLQQEKK
ncbi:hypothetical protein DPMN_171162 [Dreissena polymorpha]|uniref:Uncharacterized protein n=1 Tax=Dreissena polymorpha TaxID=45954 RepID=A0A9D4IC63_DREPO|nr:hypothetical protein DPMN_171162 [Dreissena polymorpha]